MCIRLATGNLNLQCAAHAKEWQGRHGAAQATAYIGGTDRACKRPRQYFSRKKGGPMPHQLSQLVSVSASSLLLCHGSGAEASCFRCWQQLRGGPPADAWIHRAACHCGRRCSPRRTACTSQDAAWRRDGTTEYCSRSAVTVPTHCKSATTAGGRTNDRVQHT